MTISLFAQIYFDMQSTLSETHETFTAGIPYDLLATIAALPLILLMSRKHFLIILFVTMGSITILAAALPSENAPIGEIVFAVGKSLGVIGVWFVSLQIIEIFPTEIRSTANGVLTSIVMALSSGLLNIICKIILFNLIYFDINC